MTRYSRQDVLRVLQITARQLQNWERLGLIALYDDYGFAELSQLRLLRELQGQRIRPASICRSLDAMRAVSGVANPLRQSAIVPSGRGLAFRMDGAVVDPVRRQLLFDFDATPAHPSPLAIATPARSLVLREQSLQTLFLEAIQAEEQGDRAAALEVYSNILEHDPNFTAALINLGTIHYHQGRFLLAEQFYRRATVADPNYVLAFFDLGNVLDELRRSDESIQAYRAALALAPEYADAHYNLAMAYERKGLRRQAMTHWAHYLRLDRSGPWSEHARTQLRKLLSREKLAITHRARAFCPPAGKVASKLQLVSA
uniref:TPR repeat protein n=1 Tax=mine drainage metagenome TaxID=410659 RepID=E6QNY6_9ZZZZ